MLDMNGLNEMFNNKNRHEEFERENYAEIIEKNMNCKENEKLINTFTGMYLSTVLKGVPDIYVYKLHECISDKIKLILKECMKSESIVAMEKTIDYEKEYSDLKQECKKVEDEIQKNMIDFFFNYMVAKKFCEYMNW